MLFKVEISEQTADNISSEVLKTSLHLLRTDIANLESRPVLTGYEAVDLEDFKELEKAFIRVIQYYVSHDEWDSI